MNVAGSLGAKPAWARAGNQPLLLLSAQEARVSWKLFGFLRLSRAEGGPYPCCLTPKWGATKDKED